MATIQDIAKEANVSTATVSRVINNSCSVSEKLREQVLSAIKKLNYTPNSVARELVTKNSMTVGLFLPDITNTFAPVIINSFQKTMSQAGYNTILCITNADDQNERESLNSMIQKRVQGLAFIGTRLRKSTNNALIEQLAEQMPVIMMDYFPGNRVAHVMTNEEDGEYIATKHLIDLGHRRIGFINGDLRYTSYYAKQRGFERAMKEAALPIRKEYLVTVRPGFEGGYSGARELLSRKDRPTAILTGGDQIAAGAYNGIADCGLRIPEDVSVVGFSGSPLASYTTPALTTINQYAHDLGSQSAHMMIEYMQSEEGHKVRDVIFEPVLIKRASCCSIDQK